MPSDPAHFDDPGLKAALRTLGSRQAAPTEMRDRLQQGILAQVEQAGVNGDSAARVPNTANIHFDHIDGEAMELVLELMDHHPAIELREAFVDVVSGDGEAHGDNRVGKAPS